MRGVGGQHEVKYNFINKGLKGAVKLDGKLCYLTRPIGKSGLSGYQNYLCG